MGGSDSRDPRKWPQPERRTSAARRTRPERRAGAGSPPPGRAEARRPGHRRTGSERRLGEEEWHLLPLGADVLAQVAPEEGLLAAAVAAREFAQAPYSAFKVGAALETTDGAIVTGCNVENASFGLTLCAERVALVKALSEGHTAFVRLVVVADTPLPTPPCGACRQLLWEYCGDIDVFLGNLQTLTGHYRLGSLLPVPFDRTLIT